MHGYEMTDALDGPVFVSSEWDVMCANESEAERFTKDGKFALVVGDPDSIAMAVVGTLAELDLFVHRAQHALHLARGD